MELDRWVIGRVEEIVHYILDSLGLPDDIALSAMIQAIEINAGILKLIGTYDMFESVEVYGVSEEASEIIANLNLSKETPEEAFGEIASEMVIKWCDYFFEYVGRGIIAVERMNGEFDGSRIIFRVRLDDGEEES